MSPISAFWIDCESADRNWTPSYHTTNLGNNNLLTDSLAYTAIVCADVDFSISDNAKERMCSDLVKDLVLH